MRFAPPHFHTRQPDDFEAQASLKFIGEAELLGVSARQRNNDRSFAVISDSLRRARPTRFSGSDLSRSGPAAHAARPSGTPASRQFWAGALRMQGFSQSSALRPTHRGHPAGLPDRPFTKRPRAFLTP